MHTKKQQQKKHTQKHKTKKRKWNQLNLNCFVKKRKTSEIDGEMFDEIEKLKNVNRAKKNGCFPIFIFKKN